LKRQVDLYLKIDKVNVSFQGMYYKRFIASTLKEALEVFPVVALLGARQTGKTTLVKEEFKDRIYLSCDEPSVRASLEKDAFFFLSAQADKVILDEIQRVPEAFVVLKHLVDAKRTPGRFLITGSANFLLMKRVSETLAGRIAIFELPGFMLAEYLHKNPSLVLIKCLKAKGIKDLNIQAKDLGSIAEFLTFIKKGSLPPAMLIEKEEMREVWFESYIQTYLERDLRELSQVASLMDFRRLMGMAALRTAQILNFSDLARDVGISVSTVRNYLNLLGSSYHLRFLPPFYAHLGKRLTKAPKLHFRDTGLALTLSGLSLDDRAFLSHPFFSALAETYLVEEIIKLVSLFEHKARFYYFRTHGGAEVDLVIEYGQRLLPIEIKTSTQLDQRKLAGLKQFLNDFKNRVPFGVVIYMGEKILKLSHNIIAIPWKVCLVG
jgi:predicted AAA+ superfamily ATPase